MQSPLVSIYLTTYNRLNYLKRSLQSLQNQDYTNIEIIICDDCSTDETEDYVQTIMKEDSRIIYLKNETNQGPSFSRNRAIEQANGVFITGLDDDDEFTSDRINYFLKNWNEQYSCLCCQIKNDENPVATKTIITLNNMLTTNSITAQIFTLKNRMDKLERFDKNFKSIEDWEFYLRFINQFGSALKLPKITYIQHDDHLKTEKRVSSSYPFSKSYLQLYIKNKAIFEEVLKNKFPDFECFLPFYLLRHKQNKSFYEKLKSSYLKRKLKKLKIINEKNQFIN